VIEVFGVLEKLEKDAGRDDPSRVVIVNAGSPPICWEWEKRRAKAEDESLPVARIMNWSGDFTVPLYIVVQLTLLTSPVGSKLMTPQELTTEFEDRATKQTSRFALKAISPEEKFEPLG